MRTQFDWHRAKREIPGTTSSDCTIQKPRTEYAGIFEQFPSASPAGAQVKKQLLFVFYLMRSQVDGRLEPLSVD